MPDLFGDVSLAEQIAEVTAEVKMRERVYARTVAAGKMNPDIADRKLAAMTAVRKTLIRLQGENDAA